MTFIRSIAGKLWAAMMALMGAILLLLWLFQVVFLQNTYVRQRVADSTRIGRTYLESVEDIKAPDAFTPLAVPESLYHVGYLVCDGEGDALYATDSLLMRDQVTARAMELFPEVLEGKPQEVRILHPITGYEYALHGEAVALPSGPAAVFTLVPLADAAIIASTAQRQLLLLSGLFILLAAGASLLVARSFSRPIREVQDAASRMAMGDLNVHLAETGVDEIAGLCRTINHLGVSLRRTDQLRHELVANVSHELRTPLSLIRGYAETVRDVSFANPERRREQLTIIIEESERLRTMVDTILDFSQLQSGLMKPDPKLCDAFELIRECAKRYRPEIERQGVILVVHVENSLTLMIDPDMLRQALYNLISNALNHTPEGGRIDVIAYPLQTGMHVDVLDSGPGIPAGDLPLIWERFYKARTPAGRRKRGSGLGLSLVRGIVESHGGSCGAENRPSGGAHFWMEFP